MSVINWAIPAQRPTEEQAVMNRRAGATESLFRICRDGRSSADLAPSFFIEAIKEEAWRERPTMTAQVLACRDIYEWVEAPFPRGIETTVANVRLLLDLAVKAAQIKVANAEQTDEAKLKALHERRALAAEALEQFVQVFNRGPGGAKNLSGTNQHTGPEVIDNNVNNDLGAERSGAVGNSREAGLRRILKAVGEGNEQAVAVIGEIRAGTKTVNRGMTELGFRPHIDPAVKAQAARDAAEMAVAKCEGDLEWLEAFEHRLRKAGAKNVADQIANLVDPALMDGGRI